MSPVTSLTFNANPGLSTVVATLSWTNAKTVCLISYSILAITPWTSAITFSAVTHNIVVTPPIALGIYTFSIIDTISGSS